VALTALVSGCSNGFDAQTDQLYQPGPGISVREDGVYLLNAAIVTDGSGNGTLIGALLNTGSRPDRLVSVSFGGGSQQSNIVGGTITLPMRQPVQLADTGNVQVSGKGIVAGTFQKVSLTFRNGAPISTDLPVLTQTEEFSTIPVAPILPSPSGAP
jgi:hypothetical protein